MEHGIQVYIMSLETTNLSAFKLPAINITNMVAVQTSEVEEIFVSLEAEGLQFCLLIDFRDIVIFVEVVLLYSKLTRWQYKLSVYISDSGNN